MPCPSVRANIILAAKMSICYTVPHLFSGVCFDGWNINKLDRMIRKKDITDRIARYMLPKIRPKSMKYMLLFFRRLRESSWMRVVSFSKESSCFIFIRRMSLPGEVPKYISEREMRIVDRGME